MAFTNAELVDIRRFCGFGAHTSFGYVFSQGYANLEVRLTALDADEIAIVRTVYLANLTALETAIVSAGANLDTDMAAVWTHNKNEVADRAGLFNRKRRDFCDFLGVVPGAGLVRAGGLVRT